MMNHAFLPILPALTAVLLATAAAVMDVRTRRIPNRLVLVSIVAALGTHFLAGGWRSVGAAATAAITAFVLMSFGFFLGGVGAGDVKWMSAMAAFSGLSSLALLMTSTALAGGMLGLLFLGRNVYVRRRLCHAK